MEWDKLGDLLGRSLSGGLNTYGDIALERKAKAQQAEEQRRTMLEREMMKQQMMQQKEAMNQKKSQLFADLMQKRNPMASQGIPDQGQPPEMPPINNVMGPQQQTYQQPNIQQEEPSIEERIKIAGDAGFTPNEISQLKRDHERSEANKLKKEEFKYKKEQDFLNRIEKKQAIEDKFKNQLERDQIQGINKVVAENYANRPILKEKRDNYKSLIDIAKNPELLRIGKGRQFLDKLGLGNMWQSPLSDVADKLINRIIVNESQTASGATATTLQGLANIKASVPNLTQNPEAFEAIANALYYTSEAQYIESKELNRLATEDGVDLKTIANRDKITKPKTKELHKRSEYALKLAQFPIDVESAMRYQPDVDFMYELPPLDQVPQGKAVVDRQTGLRFLPRNGKWVVDKKKGK